MRNIFFLFKDKATIVICYLTRKISDYLEENIQKMYSLKSTLGLVATLYFVAFVGIVFCNEEAIRQNATENDSGEVYNDIFVPTKEWQKVPKGNIAYGYFSELTNCEQQLMFLV